MEFISDVDFEMMIFHRDDISIINIVLLNCNFVSEYLPYICKRIGDETRGLECAQNEPLNKVI